MDAIDVATLVTRETLFVMLTNRDYEMHAGGYRFTPQTDVSLALRLPDWIKPREVVQLAPGGVRLGARLVPTTDESRSRLVNWSMPACWPVCHTANAARHIPGRMGASRGGRDAKLGCRR